MKGTGGVFGPRDQKRKVCRVLLQPRQLAWICQRALNVHARLNADRSAWKPHMMVLVAM
jgi:hypothetical protein